MVLAPTTEVNTTIAPTDRSSPAAISRNVIPDARIAVADAATRMFLALSIERKLPGGDNSEKPMIIPMRMMAMEACWMSAPALCRASPVESVIEPHPFSAGPS